MSRTISTSFALDVETNEVFDGFCRKFGLKKTAVVNALLAHFMQLSAEQRLNLIGSTRSPSPTALPASGRGGNGVPSSEESPVGCPAGNGQPTP